MKRAARFCQRWFGNNAPLAFAIVKFWSDIHNWREIFLAQGAEALIILKSQQYVDNYRLVKVTHLNFAPVRHATIIVLAFKLLSECRKFVESLEMLEI